MPSIRTMPSVRSVRTTRLSDPSARIRSSQNREPSVPGRTRTTPRRPRRTPGSGITRDVLINVKESPQEVQHVTPTRELNFPEAPTTYYVFVTPEVRLSSPSVSCLTICLHVHPLSPLCNLNSQLCPSTQLLIRRRIRRTAHSRCHWASLSQRHRASQSQLQSSTSRLSCLKAPILGSLILESLWSPTTPSQVVSTSLLALVSVTCYLQR